MDQNCGIKNVKEKQKELFLVVRYTHGETEDDRKDKRNKRGDMVRLLFYTPNALSPWYDLFVINTHERNKHLGIYYSVDVIMILQQHLCAINRKSPFHDQIWFLFVITKQKDIMENNQIKSS